jgi:hypothetical protein
VSPAIVTVTPQKRKTEHEPYLRARSKWDAYYTIQTHARTGRLTASYFFAGPGSDPVNTIGSTVTVQESDADAVVLNPRPELGLAEDPLTLIDDATLRSRLLDAAAEQLADRLSDAALERRVAAVEARADETTDAEAARQLRLAGALLLRSSDPYQADRRLDRLAAEYHGR